MALPISGKGLRIALFVVLAIMIPRWMHPGDIEVRVAEWDDQQHRVALEIVHVGLTPVFITHRLDPDVSPGNLDVPEVYFDAPVGFDRLDGYPMSLIRVLKKETQSA